MSVQPPPHGLPPGAMPAPHTMMGPPAAGGHILSPSQHLGHHFPLLPAHGHGMPPQMHAPPAFHHPHAVVPPPQQFMHHGGHIVNPSMGPMLPPPSSATPSPSPALPSPSPSPPPGLAAPSSAPVLASASSSSTPQRAPSTRPARPSPTGNGSTPSRKKNPPQRALGERLSEEAEVTYRLEGGQQPPYGQLEVTPITLLNSPPVYQRGSLIAVNHNYICYVVKGYMIRVINIFSAKRALLRGHTKAITDMRFCEGDEDILASVASDGRLLVWQITEESSAPDSGEESGIGHELVAAVRMEGDRWLERIIWHPALTHVLATAGNDHHAYVWDLNRIRQLKQTVEDGKSTFVYTDEPVVGVIRINVGAPINDMAFSPQGDALATALNDGRVQIWSASGGASPTDPSISWFAHRDEAWAVAFNDDGTVLITGGRHNAELAVWLLDEEQEPILRQKIKFTPPPNSDIFNHVMLDPSGQFLFVANAKSTTFVVLHLQIEPEPRFDYITEFSVAQPILSFTVINRDSMGASEPGAEVDLYCLQTKAIQMYHLTSSLCYTPVSPPSQPSSATPTPKATTTAPPPGLGDASPISEPAEAAAEQLPSSPASDQDAMQSTTPESPDKTAADGEPTPAVPETEPATTPEGSMPALSSEEEQPKETPAETDSTSAPTDSATSEPPVSDKDSEAAPAEQATSVPSTSVAPISEDNEVEREEQEPPIDKPSSDERPEPAEENEKVETENETGATTKVEDGVPADVVLGASGGDSEEISDTHVKEEPATPEKPEEELPVATATASDSIAKTEEPESASELPTLRAEESAQPEETRDETSAPSDQAVAPPPTSDDTLSQTQTKASAESGPLAVPTAKHAGSPSGRGKQPKKYKQGKSEPRGLSQHVQAASQGALPNARTEIEPSEASQALPTNSLPSDLKRLENSLLNSVSARVERSLQQFADRQLAKAEKERAEREKAERERQQRLLNSVTQTISASLNTIPQQIEKAVQKELQAALVPAVSRLLAGMEKNIAKNITEELRPHLAQRSSNGSWDKDLPPRLASEVTSRLPTASDIAIALQGQMRHALESSFRASFQDSIIPSFQSSCQAMFQQIYGTVLPGLKQTVEEAIEPGMARLSGGDLREVVQSLTNAANDMRELTARNAELYQTISQSSGRRFGEHPASNLSEPVSEAHLLQLLERDAFEQAFALALSERGFEPVRHLLQWIEPQGFFESGHTLSQIVMASLIHRVALDLHHDTLNKIDWLSNLLLHFHPHDPSIAAHSHHILHQTINHLNSLLAVHSHQPITINIKLLLHTANSLLSAPPPAVAFPSPAYGGHP